MAAQERTVKRNSTSSPLVLQLDFLSEEEENYNEEDLRRLKESILSAKGMVREANSLSSEMEKDVKFEVSLQIRREFLSPRRKGAPKRKRPHEVVIAVSYAQNESRNTTWSADKLEDKLVDMRDVYQRLQDGASKDELEMNDPFYDQESPVLIGVANLFLECLYHDVELKYSPPIINQKGEISGQLDVKIRRCQSADQTEDTTDFILRDSTPEKKGDDVYRNIRVSVVGASLPLISKWCKGIFCQYDFFNHKEVTVRPLRDVNGVIIHRGKVLFKNEHIFPVVATDEFIDYIAYDCIRFEVYGSRSTGFSQTLVEPRTLKYRSLSERWSELLKRFEMIVEVMEQNETGEYEPVELVEKVDNVTGGVFRLKQGQSRRLRVVINAVENFGSGPIAFDAVEKIAVGSVVHQRREAISLDSYTDIGLERLRERWSLALMKQRAFLDEQIRRIVDKSDRSRYDMERESELIDEWTLLQWERQAVTEPMPGTGIPGTPSVGNRHLGPTMETKMTLVFLDLTEETMILGDAAVIADDYFLDGEDEDEIMTDLPIVKKGDGQVTAVAAWDSSLHDNMNLRKLTKPKERVYIVVKVTARLSHPLPVRLVLRKRICVKIIGKVPVFTSTLKQMFARGDKRVHCGAVYEIVAGIPKNPGMDYSASLNLEEKEEEEANVLDRVSRGVSSVMSIMALDRLRQEVAVKHRVANLGRSLKKLPPPMTKPFLSLSRADLFEDFEETPSSIFQPLPAALASAISKEEVERQKDVDHWSNDNSVQEWELITMRERLEAMSRALIGKEEEVERLQESSRHLLARSQKADEALIASRAAQREAEEAQASAQEALTLSLVAQASAKEAQASAQEAHASAQERANRLEGIVAELRALCQEKERRLNSAKEQNDLLHIPLADVKMTTIRLGGGAYGEVKVGYWRGCPVAVKTFFECLDTDYYLDLFKQEIAICSRARHPNIVFLCGVTTVNDTPLRIVTELLEGSLSDVIKASVRCKEPLSLREQIDLASGMTAGISYLHQLGPNGILHGDIRSTNVVVTSLMEAKICDLGAARFAQVSLSAGPLSPEYLAPERSPEKGPRMHNTKMADVYSLGVTVIELMIGQHPVVSCRIEHLSKVAHPDVKQMCLRLIEEDPSARPGADECLAVLELIQESCAYNECAAKRMVKGKFHGEGQVSLVLGPWAQRRIVQT
ncbi:kinesin-like protein KIF13A isoform X2 [Oscarella lobularis]|uniref:kinesin-like protein KIF13A isoform X2 n=1 Tax=Oscarella lobularis TaxID=121494 RepID=UPI0033141614